MSRSEPLKLLSCYDVFSGCAWYRATVPFYEASDQGHLVSVVQGGIPRLGVESCDVLQVQRIWHPEGHEAIKRANELGKLTVFDIDDDLWALGPHNQGQQHWQKWGDTAAAIMRDCQVVTTTTERFATFLRTLHPNVHVVPNCLPDESWPRVPHIERGELLTIGWAGGNSHKADLGLIRNVMLHTVEKHPNVRFALVGALGDWIPYHPRIHCLSVVSIEDYQRVLTGFDIGLAPLEDNRFNNHKSDLKALEYGAVAIPVIASPFYATVPGVRIARTFKDWTKHLDRLIADKELRHTEGEAMRDWAETRMMSRNLKTWEAVWTSR